jgi:hypothetical protein
MKTSLICRSAGLAVTLFFSGVVSAEVLETESLNACVHAVAGANQANHLDVVHMNRRAGRGSFEYWINADVNPSKKSYCRTQRGKVSQAVHLDGQWRSAKPRRPTTAEAQTSGQVFNPRCQTQDLNSPSNIGRSLRNDATR